MPEGDPHTERARGGEDHEEPLEMPAASEPAGLQEGPYGRVFAATGTPLTDELVRSTLEAVRERR